MFVFDEKSTWKWPRPPMEMKSLKALIGRGNLCWSSWIPDLTPCVKHEEFPTENAKASFET